VEPTDQELYDQLLGYLAAEGAIEEDPEAGTVMLREFDHRALVQPLRLHLTPASFGRHLRDAASEAASLYPDIPPVDGAWRLFTVHLDEAVQAARPGETELVLGRGGVGSLRRDGGRTPLAPEVEEHLALNEYYERLIQHYADRGELDVGIGNDILVLRDLDGHAFDPPLRVHLSSAELGRQMRSAPDAEARWRTIVARIDTLAFTVDPSTTALELARGGIVARRH
jgi:hypothetical protein